jgi:outer membrane scaffolding protein for murein synthesis (MipA/OmpV family)
MFALGKGTPLRTRPRSNARLRRLVLLALLLIACGRGARAQTPSPLQEWQYSGGIVLARLFQPDLPRWRTVLGIAGEVQPVYSGAHAYRVIGGPDVLIYYRDIAFISTGEGVGYNFLRGKHYQFGLSMTYDLGRKETDDLTNLHGMGDIPAAPVAKIYGSVVLSKKFPLILRVDARQYIGGAGGAVGDAAVYMPLPGSSERFVMFAGPSITLADHHYLQSMYGVTAQQSLASGHPEFLIKHNGTASAGVGFSATKFLGEHWLINLDLAISQLRGDSAYSPIVERRTQRAIALSFGYHHETSNAQ